MHFSQKQNSHTENWLHCAGTLGKNICLCMLWELGKYLYSFPISQAKFSYRELVALCGNFGKEYMSMHAVGTWKVFIFFSYFSGKILIQRIGCTVRELWERIYVYACCGKLESIYILFLFLIQRIGCTVRELWDRIYVLVLSAMGYIHDMGTYCN